MPGPGTGASLRISTMSLTHKDALCSVLINYPHFGKNRIDTELDFWASRTMRAFVSGVRAIGAEGPRYSMLADYELTEASPDVLSVVFRINTDMGGLNTDLGMVTFTYDLDDGRQLGYSDLFGDPVGLLHFMSQYSYDQLMARLGGQHKDTIKAGTTPDPVNFALFALNPSSITLFFPPYQVADVSLGEQKVDIPISLLKPYRPLLPVWTDDHSFPFRP